MGNVGLLNYYEDYPNYTYVNQPSCQPPTNASVQPVTLFSIVDVARQLQRVISELGCIIFIRLKCLSRGIVLSPLTKVLVVLVTVLSILELGLFVAYSSKHTRLNEQVSTLNSELAAAKLLDRGHQAEGKEAVGNGCAERTGIGTVNIDVDPLVITSDFREQIHLVLGHFEGRAPIRELVADGSVDGIYVVESHARKVTPWPLAGRYSSSRTLFQDNTIDGSVGPWQFFSAG